MPNLTRRVLGCCLLTLASAGAWAADAYPTRPVRVIIPFAPGGLLDVQMRWVAERMAPLLGQPVIIENRPGGEGLIAVRAVKSAAADGYTVLAVSSQYSQALALKQDPGYEAKDFVAVGGLSEASLLMVGATSLPDTTLDQLLVRARANPETVTYGSGGVGTAIWLSTVMMAHSAGIKLLHVPYKGSAAARPDLLAGRLNLMLDTPGVLAPHIKAGQLRVYGTSATKRLTAWPDVPTLAEQGLGNFSYAVYQGVLAPAGTPKEAIARLDQALRTVVQSEAFKERCRTDGAEPTPMSADHFAERVRQDTQKVARLVADIGLPKQ